LELIFHPLGNTFCWDKLTVLEQVIQVVRRNAGKVSAGKNDSKANNGGRTQVARGVFIYFVVVALPRNSSLLTVQIPRATFYPQFNCLINEVQGK